MAFNVIVNSCVYSGTRPAGGDTIPTDAEQATGLEKIEYDAMAAGIQVCVILGSKFILGH